MGKRKLVLFVAAIAALGACNGTGSGSAAGSAPTAPAPSVTTGRPKSPGRAAISVPATTPEFSFDDSVPPPRLVNTGTDYAAILRSLEAYGNWIGAHRPDPALALHTVARGTRLLDAYVHDIRILKENDKREIERLTGPTSYTILSATPDAFSARVVENISVHQIIDRSGHVVSERRYAGATTYLDVCVLANGRWYLAAADVQSAGDASE